jgi:hypothetical protein
LFSVISTIKRAALGAFLSLALVAAAHAQSALPVLAGGTSSNFGELITTQTGTSYTVVATTAGGGDCGTKIDFTASSAVAIALPVTAQPGCFVDLFQGGAGALTVTANSPGSLLNPSSSITSSAQNSGIRVQAITNSGTSPTWQVTSIPVSGGSGSGVTSIAAGAGLSGGTITTSGTLSLNIDNANVWLAEQTFSTSTSGPAALGTVVNGSSAVITGSTTVFRAQLNNANTAANSVGVYEGYNCAAMTGGGSAPGANYCFRNDDATALVATDGPLMVGSTTNITAQGIAGFTGTSTGQFVANTTWFNSAGTGVAMITNSGAMGVGFATNGSFNAQFIIGDNAGTSEFGTHIAVKQTTAPGITNATLDATASDVAGTLTLTAANPVLTFHVAYPTAPHCGLSFPSGTAIPYSVSATSITFTGGASGNTVTYNGCTQ